MKQRKIALILPDIRSTYNVGSIFRSAECLGAAHIYICGYTPYPQHYNDARLPHISTKIHNQIAKTALGAESIVPFSVYNSESEAIQQAKIDGYIIVGIEQDDNSVPMDAYTFSGNVAFIFGNELKGISGWTKQQCDVILEITQYGTKESLNVASAAVVALYAARTQYKP